MGRHGLIPSASSHLRITHGTHSHAARVPHAWIRRYSVHLLWCVLLLLLLVMLLLLLSILLLALVYSVLYGL